MIEIKIIGGEKRCSRCGFIKPVAKFKKDRKIKCGYSSACISCLGYNKNITKNDKMPSLEGEIWLPVKDHEALYEISNLGRLKSLLHIDLNGHTRKEKIFSFVSKRWYTLATLCKGSAKTHIMVHRIVATAFHPNPENKPEVNHKNTLKWDNRAINLEWVTVSENSIHACAHGLNPDNSGELNGMSKIKKEEAIAIYKSTLSVSELSKIFKVSEKNIYLIRAGKRWASATNSI